ncbi:hypothetical protein [Vibrio hippocampi]|uniref:Uncharacterized protein n=1 Tax=Vibrio hippocampi TaxID=654686 RepID=A0ABM8ZQ63_9VIBR|nr:hypothetical protein [Vibrio hippocampi]CAH0530377.1 hypothetical protein VHP8226_04020 [Vibrio hippocampi]
MPVHHCQACQKDTAHKAIMRRTVNHSDSTLQSFQQIVSQLLSGSGYYKLERQLYCRVCNKQNQSVATNIGQQASPA